LFIGGFAVLGNRALDQMQEISMAGNYCKDKMIRSLAAFCCAPPAAIYNHVAPSIFFLWIFV